MFMQTEQMTNKTKPMTRRSLKEIASEQKPQGIQNIYFPIDCQGGLISSIHQNPLRGMVNQQLLTEGIDLKAEAVPYRIRGVVGLTNAQEPNVPVSRIYSFGGSFAVRTNKENVAKFLCLANKKAMLGLEEILIGNAITTDLIPSSTLYTYCFHVNRIDTPEAMHEYLTDKLEGITASIDVLKRRVVKIKDGCTIVGFSVRLSNLSDDDSLLIQSFIDGKFGGKGHYGCGFWHPVSPTKGLN